MELKEIIDYLEKELASVNQYNSDFSGVQFGYGTDKRIIKRALITITPSLSAIKSAINQKASLIISYNPLTPNALIQFTGNIAKKFHLLSSHRIVLYVLNKAVDIYEGGIIDIIAEKIYLDIRKIFYQDISSKKVILGRICVPKRYPEENGAFTLNHLILRIKKYLGLDPVKFSGNKNQEIENICVSSIISYEILVNAKKIGCNCFITKEIGDKDIRFANDLGISLLELTHHCAEFTGLGRLWNLISLKFPEVRFMFYNSKDLFSYE